MSVFFGGRHHPTHNRVTKSRNVYRPNVIVLLLMNIAVLRHPLGHQLEMNRLSLVLQVLPPILSGCHNL